MKGTMLIYPADALETRCVEFDGRPPSLDELQAGVGGGLIEVVPLFDHIRINGQRCEAVAFCNEEGKLDGLPLNKQATLLWEQIVSNNGENIRDARGQFIDVLVGPIVVLYGDQEFMEAI